MLIDFAVNLNLHQFKILKLINISLDRKSATMGILKYQIQELQKILKLLEPMTPL